MDEPTMGVAPPQLSADGLWWWNGKAWVPAGTGAQPTAAASHQLENGLHFLRSERHVAVLLLVANIPYSVWWGVGLTKLAKRERFPNAQRASRIVGDLVDKERELTGKASTSAKVIWLWLGGSLLFWG
jgi:hypothetical protein